MAVKVEVDNRQQVLIALSTAAEGEPLARSA